MAAYDILFADPGGEYYFSLGVGAPGVWNGGANAPALVNNAPTGRATQYAITLGTISHLVQRNFGTNYQSWCIGFAAYLTGSYNNNIILQLLDNGTTQVELRQNNTGTLYFTRNGTQIGGTSSNLLPIGWHYVEVKVTVASGTSGSAEVRVDGVTWLTVTGVSTQTSANAYANQIRWNGGSSTAYFKDLYIMADTGTGPYTTYLGDITVAVFYPNGAGVNSAWTPNGAASGWQCVDDGTSHSGTWPNGDTTYISSATAGQISDFSKPALSLTGSIYAVIVASYMRKDDAGARSAANTLLSGGTESDGATQSLGNTYQYYFDVYEKDPHTSAAWSLTGFNAMTFGTKLIS